MMPLLNTDISSLGMKRVVNCDYVEKSLKEIRQLSALLCEGKIILIF